MPVQIDAPNAIGSRDDWGLQSAASKLLAVATNDGNGSYIHCYSGGAQKVQLFRFPALVGVTDPVTSALLQVWGAEHDPGVGTRSFYLYWNGAQVGSNFGPTFHANTGVYISNASYTAVAPTLAAVNGEHGFIGYGAGGPEQKWAVVVTQFYRSVTFEYAASTAGTGFAHLIGSLIGAIGSGLLLRDMPALARAVFKRTGTLILPAEYAEALRAWRRERHVAVA